jgi:hypothetical protein
MLSIFPLEIIRHILSYDRRFTVKKLDKTKYSKAIEVLLAKPRIIVVSNVNGSSTYFRSFVRFNGLYEIEYTNYGFDFNLDEITYRFRKGAETHNKLILL